MHQALKRFTHGWLSELANLATVTAADAYVRYRTGEDDDGGPDTEKEERASEVREEKVKKNDEKRTKRRVTAKEA